MFAKFISETEIEAAPKNKGQWSNYDQNIELMKADGYLEVKVIEQPSDEKPFVRYRVVEDCIEQYAIARTVAEQNEVIRQTRESLYRATSDYLKADYDEAVARGADNTEELKKAWLSSKDEIRENNPYIQEE